jgi:hypothetical protein
LVSLACPAGADVNDSCKAVYYLGADGKRYVFPNQKTFDTWYDSFADVRVVSLEELSTYAIGGNVTYRPGVKLIKVDTDPKVYAVNKNGALHWVQTEALANQLYGVNWAQQVEDIPVSFFINYRLDSDVATANDYNPTAAKAGSPTINANKGL